MPTNLFNAGALFILFREALEAAVVIGVLLNFVQKTASRHPALVKRLRKQIWLGVGLGLAISILVGIAFSVVFYVLKKDLFGSFEPVWEGSFKFLACILLTIMGFGMLHAGDLEAKWERRMLKAGLAETAKKEIAKERLGTPETEVEVNRAESSVTVVDSSSDDASTKKDFVVKDTEESKQVDRPWALFFLTFSVVLREGLESVIFLTGVGQGEPYSIIIPGLLGIFLGILVGKLLHSGFAQLKLKTFLFYSAIFMFIISAGLAANAAHEFEEFGYIKSAEAKNNTLYASYPAPITPDSLKTALANAGLTYPEKTSHVSTNSFRKRAEAPLSGPKIELNAENVHCPSLNGTARTTCKVRTYYIAAEETEWDYAPSGYDHVSGNPLVLEKDTAGVFTLHAPNKIGSRYIKALYYEYTDDTFTTRKAKFDWQGFLGPIIRAEVGDVVQIVFQNMASTPISIHPHGSIYRPDSEGAATQWNMMGAPVNTGETYQYNWAIAEESGPAVNDPNSILWAYHSHLTEGNDIYAGSVGPILIYRRGFLNDATNLPTDVAREFISLFGVFDESMSTYIDVNIAAYTPELIDYASLGDDAKDEFDESNKMHSVNGRVYNNLDGYVAIKGERVRWHVFAIGNEVDLHTAHWHGNTFVEGGHRRDVMELLPATFRSVEMTVNNAGTWMLHCHVVDHIAAGMITSYQVMNAAGEEENVWTTPLGPQEMPAEYPEMSPVIFDMSACCDHEQNFFFQIMNAFMGWRAIGTVATVVSYFGYWGIVAGVAALIPRFKKKKAASSDNDLAMAEESKEAILPGKEESVSGGNCEQAVRLQGGATNNADGDASYDRFSEGRRLWGQLTSQLRNVARAAFTGLTVQKSELGDKAAQKVAKLVVAFLFSVKHYLRAGDLFAEFEPSQWTDKSYYSEALDLKSYVSSDFRTPPSTLPIPLANNTAAPSISETNNTPAPSISETVANDLSDSRGPIVRDWFLRLESVHPEKFPCVCLARKVVAMRSDYDVHHNFAVALAQSLSRLFALCVEHNVVSLHPFMFSCENLISQAVETATSLERIACTPV
ncbi:hephaestin-like 1 [Gonapodya sp. JEL0774]|nr:hephaestin-like 1 [Gonapodya sp. JEL0774]